MVDGLYFILIALEKCKGEHNRQKIEIIFDLYQNVVFRLDGLAGVEVAMRLMKI